MDCKGCAGPESSGKWPKPLAQGPGAPRRRAAIFCARGFIPLRPAVDPTNANLLSFLQSTGTISAPQAVEIATHFTPRTLEKHQFLLQAGRVSDEYLFLDRGLLRAFVHDPDGNDVTTGFYTGGRVVFEVASFFNRPPASPSRP